MNLTLVIKNLELLFRCFVLCGWVSANRSVAYVIGIMIVDFPGLVGFMRIDFLILACFVSWRGNWNLELVRRNAGNIHAY